MPIARPAPTEYDTRYAKYIARVPETDLPQAMLRQIEATRKLVARVPNEMIDVPCAAGEWTVREILGHIFDTERIFIYRILCVARGDTAPLPRADENMYVRNAEFGRYALADMLDEFELVRRSNASFLSHLSPTAWDRVGTMSGLPISTRAIAFLMLGHERHHLETILTKYLHEENP